VRILFVSENVEAIGRKIREALINPFLQHCGADSFEDLCQRHLHESLVARVHSREGSRGRLAHHAGQRHFHRTCREELLNGRQRQSYHRFWRWHLQHQLAQLIGKLRDDCGKLQLCRLHARHRYDWRRCRRIAGTPQRYRSSPMHHVSPRRGSGTFFAEYVSEVTEHAPGFSRKVRGAALMPLRACRPNLRMNENSQGFTGLDGLFRALPVLMLLPNVRPKTPSIPETATVQP
jgi:hypothetical protein